MSIVSTIEAQIASLRTKLGGLGDDTEAYLTQFLNRAKAEEGSLDSKIQDEISHLLALGYTVTPPNPAAPAPTTP